MKEGSIIYAVRVKEDLNVRSMEMDRSIINERI